MKSIFPNGVVFNMSNGKGKIENGGHLFSRLHFAEISAGKLGTLELAVNNSSFQAETAKDVLGKSYYADLTFGTIENYDINGHGGKVDIQKAKKIKMKHINLEMSLGDAESISAKLNHSQVQSKKVGSISMDLLNTDFKVAEAKSVIGKSQWGQLDIGTIERYDNNSHGTKVNIDKVNLVKAKGWSTELSIKEVVQSLEVDFDLGKCDATISSHAPHINLVGKNAHFDLIIPTQAKFQFGIKSNAKNYSYPKDLQVHQQIPKATHHEEQGYYRDSTATNWLKAHLQWGTLQLNKVSRK